MYLNRFIQIFADNTFNVTVLDCNDFVDNLGLLKINLCSKPYDPIHINNSGVSKIVTLIKDEIHYRVPVVPKRTYKVDGRPYSGVNRESVNRESVNHERMNRGRAQNGVRREGGMNMMSQHTTGNIYAPRPLWS